MVNVRQAINCPARQKWAAAGVVTGSDAFTGGSQCMVHGGGGDDGDDGEDDDSSTKRLLGAVHRAACA